MKKQLQFVALFILIATLFSSCEAIGTIFKAGMGFGIFIVVIIIVAIIFVISKFAGKK
jgi:membrane protein insertase Oxa1/YidC/SpoIIIJ